MIEGFKIDDLHIVYFISLGSAKTASWGKEQAYKNDTEHIGEDVY